MVSGGQRKRTDRYQAQKYHMVARSLLGGASVLMELASEGDSYGNAIAVLAIHAAIAYNDALTISYGEVKSTDGQHTRAADLLTEVLKGHGTREVSSRANQLRAILGSKDRVSYTGTFYRLEDAAILLNEVVEFATWADAMYQRRPV